MPRSLVPAFVFAFACFVALSAAGSGPAIAAGEKVDVELVLAADGSGSIDEGEFRLQRQGYARAIAHQLVLNAIRGGEHQKIAVMYLEWGAPQSVEVIVDWAIVKDATTARAFAERLIAAPRKVWGYNSISAAIVKATQEIASNAYDGERKIIDVSGDGPQMNGPPLTAVRAQALAAGITINGLVIASRGGGVVRRFRGQPLRAHYEQDIIGGPGAFVMVADEKTPFESVILQKLVREVARLR